jgi:hypothetical protein
LITVVAALARSDPSHRLIERKCRLADSHCDWIVINP